VTQDRLVQESGERRFERGIARSLSANLVPDLVVGNGVSHE